ncbi:hypothetical protein DKL61_10320 [Gammaproteobacteria bacterium ESL0073]|nr:hypothetical protein DKL61_10320 [Gammaproteobacteria bacterium ESL0073]
MMVVSVFFSLGPLPWRIKTLDKRSLAVCNAHAVDHLQPLVITVARSSRYKALFLALGTTCFTCIFLFAYFSGQLGWEFALFFFLMTVFDSYFVVKYWCAYLVPVVVLDGAQVLINNVIKTIPVERVVAFDYKQDVMGTLIFTVDCEEADLLLKRRLGGPMVLERNGLFELRLIVYIGSFAIQGKRLKPEQVKQAVSDYIEQAKLRLVQDVSSL